MGLGILLLGYLFFFNLVQGPFTDIFGALLLVYAHFTLSVYSKRFLAARTASVVYAAVSGVSFLCALLRLLDLLPYAVLISSYLGALSTVCRLCLITLMLRGLQFLGFDTEVPHVVVRAFRNRIFTYIFYGCWLALTLTQGIATDAQLQAFLGGFSVALLLVGLVYHFLNAKLILSCNIFICLEGDEDMPEGQSKNIIVNFVNRQTAKVEDRMLERKRLEAEEKARIKAEKDRHHQHKQRKNERRR